MIIIDFSGILVSNIHQLIKLNGDFDDNLYRHMLFMSILGYKKRFADKYGKLVFAIDAQGEYWRHDDFPPYKHKRKAAKKLQQSKNAHVDWSHAFGVAREVVEELKTVFPYKVIEVNKCEADDIIGTICGASSEEILIISQDHDFRQLQRHPNVQQHCPRSKVMIRCSDPEKYLREHIIRGDSGDGIPNILSDGDCFVKGVRQTAIKEIWLNSVINKDILDYAGDSDVLDRHRENEQLVDLRNTPEHLKAQIIEQFENPDNGGANKNIQNYLIKNKLSNLLTDLQYLLEKK